MKKTFKNVLAFAMARVLALGVTSCSSDDDTNGNGSSNTSTVMSSIVANYVDNIVRPTYSDLAENTQT